MAVAAGYVHSSSPEHRHGVCSGVHRASAAVIEPTLTQSSVHTAAPSPTPFPQKVNPCSYPPLHIR